MYKYTEKYKKKILEKYTENKYTNDPGPPPLYISISRGDGRLRARVPRGNTRPETNVYSVWGKHNIREHTDLCPPCGEQHTMLAYHAVPRKASYVMSKNR